MAVDIRRDVEVCALEVKLVRSCRHRTSGQQSGVRNGMRGVSLSEREAWAPLSTTSWMWVTAPRACPREKTVRKLVTEQDFVGILGTDTFSPVLFSHSFLKYPANSIWWTFLSCFTDAKTTTKWEKLTTWWSWAHRPQTYQGLRIDNVIPAPALTWPLKMLCWNPSESLGFLSTSCPGCLAWYPAISATLSITTTQCQQIGFTEHGQVDPSLDLILFMYSLLCARHGVGCSNRSDKWVWLFPSFKGWGLCSLESRVLTIVQPYSISLGLGLLTLKMGVVVVLPASDSCCEDQGLKKSNR